ncbi:MAG TPA: tetratricopeptide repeat protein [Bacteroidota bacterium]|nr:tetratricopeptide repeat protein [Bacteroidota bacterium]
MSALFYLGTYYLPHTHIMSPSRKQILFSLVPVSLLALLVVIAECGLRLFVPSLDQPLVRQVNAAGLDLYQVNRGYLEKYFPAGAAMVPELKPSLLTGVKAKNQFRVFCIGESSMFGTPYEFSATIPALIRTQLRHLLPDKEVEVVNFGASAINTNVIADMAPDLASLRPDLVLIYTGHNEFYGPDGVGAPWIEKRWPSLTPLKYRAREFRIVMLAQRFLASIGRGSAPADRNLMKEVSRGATVEIGSPEAERIFAVFSNNLRRIFRTFRDDGIPVIASDVTSNLLFPPFAYPPRPEFGAIPGLVASGSYREAIDRLLASRRADSADAFTDYWIGKAFAAKGDADSGISFLRRARDEDLLKFRAPGKINEIIHQVCAEERVPCVSADSLFCRLSPGGIPGGELFWEHLHPNARGYDAIARLFLTGMRSLGYVAAAGGTPPPALLPFDRDSLNLTWLDMAYGELSVRNITGRWPFSDYTVRTPCIDSATAAEKEILLQLYNRKLGWADACARFAQLEENTGRWREAARTYGALIGEYPLEYYPHYRLAALCKEQGELDRAIAEYERTLALNPSYVFALIDLGLVLNNAGRFDDARSDLMKALALTEGKDLLLPRAQTLYGLAAVAANTGDIPGALGWVDRSLRISPSYLPAERLRAQLTRR